MIFKALIILFSVINLFPSPLHANDPTDIQTYIIHVESPEFHPSSQSADLTSWYRSFLPTTTASTTEGDDRIVYSYNSVFKGFAARLSLLEVRAMQNKDGFISARPEKKLSLHTTHSPNFLGLNLGRGAWRDSNYGRGVIIGVIDTGVFPDHPSFSGEGMPPPPTKWKGRCEFSHTTCNNKIIGARYFNRSIGQSPVDEDGHGTHTASTAAGNFVQGANVFGNANGTASGIAPRAHLAIYKVCSPFCLDSDILAAMDSAIDDGVDVLSLSLGGGPGDEFFHDYIAIGAFSAMQKGILVSCSAGNAGPLNFSSSNEAPWILTVGASTIDRSITATALLGNNETFDGQSAFQPPDFPLELFPLIYPPLLSNSDLELQFCPESSLNQIDVKGKIVVCEVGLIPRIDKGKAVKNAGGAGMILVNSQELSNTTFAEAHVIPATHVSYADGLKIKDYVNSTSTPTATILFKGTIIGDHRAPVVAAFSSRGPNLASRGILKPDIIGPGVNILAAWPFSVDNNTRTKSTFNIISGTSMSCPHISGIAALIKSSHPLWSPAAIKSAIMTTADVVNHFGESILDATFLPADIFATGSGHVNPSRAKNPGLVYDLKPEDYIPYLCGLYKSEEVGLILQQKVNCSAGSIIPEAQLNYPSFAITFNSFQPATKKYSRTVTNVGEPNSSYVVEIVPPTGVDIVVEPGKLEFSEVNQKLQYNVTFSRSATAAGDNVVQGFLKWNSVRYSVRSPIAVLLTEF